MEGWGVETGWAEEEEEGGVVRLPFGAGEFSWGWRWGVEDWFGGWCEEVGVVGGGGIGDCRAGMGGDERRGEGRREGKRGRGKIPCRSGGSMPKPGSPGLRPALRWSSCGSRWY